MSETNERNSDGTFSTGNAGGPGRPRRAIELEYLAAVADACRPERWTRIVEAACVAAEAGDDKARQWLSKYLLGAEPPTLLALARRDVAGVSPDDELAAQLAVDSLTLSERLSQFGFGPDLTAFETAAAAARMADDIPAGVRDSVERLRKKARTAA
jgi:hypothetical protein